MKFSGAKLNFESLFCKLMLNFSYLAAMHEKLIKLCEAACFFEFTMRAKFEVKRDI